MSHIKGRTGTDTMRKFDGCAAMATKGGNLEAVISHRIKGAQCSQQNCHIPSPCKVPENELLRRICLDSRRMK
jgi:hypothetical protein